MPTPHDWSDSVTPGAERPPPCPRACRLSAAHVLPSDMASSAAPRSCIRARGGGGHSKPRGRESLLKPPKTGVLHPSPPVPYRSLPLSATALSYIRAARQDQG